MYTLEYGVSTDLNVRETRYCVEIALSSYQTQECE